MAASTLLLLRHGPALDPRPGQADDDRALKPSGVRLVEELGQGLARLGLTMDQGLTSPYRRARETMEALARGLGAPLPTTLAPELVPGGNPAAAELLLRAWVVEHPPGSCTLAVSHLPLVEHLVLGLCGCPLTLPTAHGALMVWDGHGIRLHARIQPHPPFLDVP